MSRSERLPDYPSAQIASGAKTLERYTACGEAWRFDDGGPGENNMHFCHSCGKSLRIKGGQHGTE